jgi:hypothetical protein
MVEVFGCQNDIVPKINTTLLHVMVFDFSRQFTLPDGEILVGELAAHDILQRVVFIGDRAVNIQFRTGNVEGGEERKSQDMIPVGMGKENIRLDGAFGQIVGYHVVAKFPDSRTGINDDKPVSLAKSDFNTGSIAAIFPGIWTRTGD